MKEIDNRYKHIARHLSGESCDEQVFEKYIENIDSHAQILSTFWDNYFPKVSEATKNRIASKTLSQILESKPAKTIKMMWWYSAVAVLAISLGLSVLWGLTQGRDSKMIQYVANAGETKNIVLPDGTSVSLNSGSTLIIQDGFKASKRQVVLLGEGYFEVEKDEKKPFEITTSHLKVTVLGTQFNLKAYPEDKNILTSLDEGKVQLDAAFNQAQPVFLKPGQEALLNKENGHIEVRDYALNNSGQWKDGKIIFYNNSMSEIATMLKRKFDVEIIIMDDEVKDYKFSGDFSTAELFELLGYLSAARPFHYKLSGDYIIITK